MHFKSDRRKFSNRTVWILIIMAILCYAAGMVLAAEKSTGNESLVEHSVAIMSLQWWLIGGAFGVCMALVVYIFLDLKKDIKEFKDDLKVLYGAKVDKDYCVRIHAIEREARK